MLLHTEPERSSHTSFFKFDLGIWSPAETQIKWKIVFSKKTELEE